MLDIYIKIKKLVHVSYPVQKKSSVCFKYLPVRTESLQVLERGALEDIDLDKDIGLDKLGKNIRSSWNS